MDEQEAREFESRFINQDNCPLDFDFLYIKPDATGSRLRNQASGYNVLHFNSRNRPDVSTSTRDFIENTLKTGEEPAQECKSDSEVLQHAVKKSREKNQGSQKGIYLEFGFCTGRSLNFIAALGYDKSIFGFDSTDGLPSAWKDKPGRFPQGTFRYLRKYKYEYENGANGEEKKNRMILFPREEDESAKPFIPFTPLPNVELILGEIDETLPVFKEYIQHKKFQIELIHIDTDIRESCDSVYGHLGDLIMPDKTVIVLDEGYNWVGEANSDDAWKNDEYGATMDFQRARGYSIDYLAYNVNHQQLALVFRD